MTNEEMIRRAAEAQQLLRNPLLLEALDGLEQGAIERLAGCNTHDTKLLQTTTMALQTVRTVRRRLELWVSEGRDAAERQIRREEHPTLLDRASNRFRRSA